MKIINKQNWNKLRDEFESAEPFNHVIIDNFFNEEFAAAVASEFPSYDDNVWFHYKNAIEDKKVCNMWDKFPKDTYQAFNYLTNDFTDAIRFMTNDSNIRADQGLHGGGWHAHAKGGNLNIHLDYSIHPKLKKQRKVNIIIYMTPDWKPEYGGGLELWSHNEETGWPKECIKTVENKFNRAVIFDTTQNSWHGLPVGLNCPDGIVRQSFAVYYVTEPTEGIDPREKALFAPYKEQANDPEIMDLIRKRSNVNEASGVYRK
jgi:Rps23 Pro-64 3,4-dihydroxylase Tpa1-like proline 4-hydroxylase